MKHVPKRYFDALAGLSGRLFYAFLFQVIIPGSWIFGLLVHIPKFMALNVKDNACKWMDEGWPQKGFYVLWSAIIVAAMVLMVGLYSRIVYTLWLKRNAENQLAFQQRVSINKKVQHVNIFLSLSRR